MKKGIFKENLKCCVSKSRYMYKESLPMNIVAVNNVRHVVDFYGKHGSDQRVRLPVSEKPKRIKAISVQA